MTRNSAIKGYTELDIMLLRAGAPTRFDSPYWTTRKIDWSALSDVFIAPVLKLAKTVAKATAIRPTRITA